MRLNVVVSEKEVKGILGEYKKGVISKSECIRSLFMLGLSVKEISEEMNIIYNMVYNISKKMVIRDDLEERLEVEVKVKIEDEIKEEYDRIKSAKGRVKKSELVNLFIKKGRGEGYIYSKLKLMDLDFVK